MLRDDLAIRRNGKAHRTPQFVGAREAAEVLGISRPVLNSLAKQGRIPAKMIDKPGSGRRWRFKVSELLRLKQEGKLVSRNARPRRIRVAWVRMLGPIPRGYRVIPRDGDLANTAAGNLALAPLAWRLKGAARRARPSGRQVRWTPAMRAIIRRDFAARSTEEIATQLGISAQAVRSQARRMRLRKSLQYIIRRAREARSRPLGAERYEKETDRILGLSPWPAGCPVAAKASPRLGTGER